jgi:hypothetical protein
MLFLALPAPTYPLTRPVGSARQNPCPDTHFPPKSLVIIMKVPARLTQYPQLGVWRAVSGLLHSRDRCESEMLLKSHCQLHFRFIL